MCHTEIDLPVLCSQTAFIEPQVSNTITKIRANYKDSAVSFVSLLPNIKQFLGFSIDSTFTSSEVIDPHE